MIRRLSLRTKAAVLLVLVIVVVSVVFAFLQRGAVDIRENAAADQAVGDFDNANHDFRDELVDQETGLRGFALSGNRLFLEPYDAGRTRAVRTEAFLTSHTPPAARTALANERAAAHDWETWAAGRRGSVEASGPGPQPADLEGKRLFDKFRAAFAALDNLDSRLRAASDKALDDALATQDAIRTTGWVLVLATLVGLAILIFVAILRPLLAQADALGRLDGSAARSMPGSDRQDEIGRLARALEAFQLSLGERLGLAQAMADVGAETEVDRVLEIAVARVADLVQADDVAVTMGSGELRHIVGSKSGLFTVGLPIEGPQPGTDALGTNRPVRSHADELPESPIKAAVTTLEYGPMLLLPLISGKEAVGTLAIMRKRSRAPFTDAEADRVNFISPFIATALRAARLISDLREANSVKSRFLANMSHELRTPLNAILGFSQVLSAEDFGPLNERQARYAAHIGTSGRRLLDLINDILDLAKVEAGLLQVAREPIDVAPVVLESRSQVERQANAKGIELIYQMKPGLWAMGDARRLQQVVLNLLSNAIKFTPDGGRVLVTASELPDQKVSVTVTDTGIGIAPHELELVFDEFAQSDNGESREQKGTGLGLSLSRKLTELMEGSLTLSSDLGKGSRFTVTLGSTAPPSGPPTDPNVGQLVMVVEDEASNREFLTMSLERAGFRTAGVSGERAALRVLERTPPAAVVLDINLADGDGWSLLDTIALRPGPPIPVIAVTATDEAAPERLAQLAAFMTKPVDRDELIENLRRALTLAPVPAEAPHIG